MANDQAGHDHGTHEHDGHNHDACEEGAYCADFDLKAATWDDPVKIARAEVVADAIVAAVRPVRGTKVFEYGAGTGLVTEALGDRVGQAVLADTSEGMRSVMVDKIADGRLRDATVVDVDLSVDGVDIPGRDFDLVITVLVMHHVGDVDTVLGRFAEMLAPGGHLCVVDFDAEDGSFHGEGFTGHHGFARPDIARRLEAAGFVDIDVVDCASLEREDGTFPMFLATGTRPRV